MFFYTYVLEGQIENSTELYIGVTDNLRKRLAKHLSHRVRATKKYKVLQLVYYEACKN